MNQEQIARAYGFDPCPVFLEAAPEVLEDDEPSTLGAQGDIDFFNLAADRLGGVGQLTATEGQALSTMAGWGQDATTTLLSNLDPTGQALFATAVQGAQDLSHGVNAQSIAAVTALAASAIGGPVAGAAVGGLFSGLNVAKDFLLSVAKTLGIAATAPPIDQFCGWIDQTKGVLKPWGPSDPGDGTPQNPGWIDSWAWISSRIGRVQVPLFGSQQWVWALPGLQTGNNGCSATYVGPPEPLIAPQNPIGTDFNATLVCEYLRARSLEDNGGGAQFETFFVPLLFHNLDLANNCSPIAPLPFQVLLGKAVDVWNAAHQAGTPRTIAAQTGTQSLAYVPTIATILAGDYGGTSLPPITLNTGPAVMAPTANATAAFLQAHGAEVAAALQSQGASPAAAAPAAPAPAAHSSAAPVVATVAVAGAGVGLWWLLGKPLSTIALEHGWRHLLGRFGR